MLTKLDALIEVLKKAKEELAKDSKNPAFAPKDRKVKELQAQIDAGTYKPDPKKIADKMIQAGVIKKDDEEDGVEKSNYGPKGAKQYNSVVNIKRKVSRTNESVEGAGPNKEVRSYSTKPGQLSSKQQAAAEAKKTKALSGKPKVFSQEEKEAFAAKRGLTAVKKTQYKDYAEDDAAAPLIPSKDQKETKDEDKKKLNIGRKSVELIDFNKCGQWTLRDDKK